MAVARGISRERVAGKGREVSPLVWSWWGIKIGGGHERCRLVLYTLGSGLYLCLNVRLRLRTPGRGESFKNMTNAINPPESTTDCGDLQGLIFMQRVLKLTCLSKGLKLAHPKVQRIDELFHYRSIYCPHLQGRKPNDKSKSRPYLSP